MISNSLDIDFIHGDIHGLAFKKVKIITPRTSKAEMALSIVTSLPLYCIILEVEENGIVKGKAILH